MLRCDVSWTLSLTLGCVDQEHTPVSQTTHKSKVSTYKTSVLRCLNALQRQTHMWELSQSDMRKSWFTVSAGTLSSPQDFQDFQVFQGFTVAIIWNLERWVNHMSVTNRLPHHQRGCLVAFPFHSHDCRWLFFVCFFFNFCFGTPELRLPRHLSQECHWLVSHCSPNAQWADHEISNKAHIHWFYHHIKQIVL